MSEKYESYTLKRTMSKLINNGTDFDGGILQSQIRYAVHGMVDKIIDEGMLRDYFSITQDSTETQVDITVTSVIHEYLKRIDELECLVDFHKDRSSIYEGKYNSERLSNESFVNKLKKALKILSENNLMEQYIKEGGLE